MNRRTFVSSATAAIGASTFLGKIMPSRYSWALAPEPEVTTRCADEPIPVAFVISEGANVIDLAGAWEVFQDTMLGDPERHEAHREGFQLYTVSDSTEPIRATAGLTLLPHYSLDKAPEPRIISVGAQRGSARIHEWLREQAASAELIMSVCTGAFQLGRAGILDGKQATTHHDFWDDFARDFPKVDLVRGPRFVVNEGIMTAGGLTSGIDLALHVVEMYYGREIATATAEYMEYESRRWAEAG